jgi:hypothetical protein
MEKIIIINDKEFKQCAIFDRVYASKDGWVVSVHKNGQFGEPTKGHGNMDSGGKKLKEPNAMIFDAPCKPYKNDKGKICYSKKTNIGALVLLAWVGTPAEAGLDEHGAVRDQPDHINRTPTDNRVENLRWTSRSENNRNRGNSKRRIDNIERNDFAQFMEV